MSKDQVNQVNDSSARLAIAKILNLGGDPTWEEIDAAVQKLGSKEKDAVNKAIARAKDDLNRVASTARTVRRGFFALVIHEIGRTESGALDWLNRFVPETEVTVSEPAPAPSGDTAQASDSVTAEQPVEERPAA